MMRPTTRAVLIFVSGIPLALFVVIYDPSLWPLSFNYGLLVLLAMGTDALLALLPRRLEISVAVPPRLYVGEQGAITVRLGSGAYRRRIRIEAIAEQRGEIEPPTIGAAELAPGSATRIALPVIPRRRGQVHLDGVWLRWYGPLSLVEFRRRLPLDRCIDVLPNVRNVHGT